MWRHYLKKRPTELKRKGVRLFPEVSLAAMVDGHRFLATYDLLAFLPGDPTRVLIIDWKTSSKRTPSAILQNRVQSRIYPFVLALSGACLNNNQPIDPAQITMIYWFAAHPTEAEKIGYDQDHFEYDRAYLTKLAQEAAVAASFPLTSDEKACRFCVYRSFCDRGLIAGPVDETDDDLELDALTLDWEQITEIAY
jgi:hypothetical protein